MHPLLRRCIMLFSLAAASGRSLGFLCVRSKYLIVSQPGDNDYSVKVQLQLVFDRMCNLRVSGCAESSVLVGVWGAVLAAEDHPDVSADGRQVPLRVQSARSVQHIPGSLDRAITLVQ